MKIKINREPLLSAFQIAASVAPSRSPKAILQNVKLDITEDSATISATDLDMGIRVEAKGVTVEQSGSVVLPVDRFGRILRESSDEELTLESDGQGVTVRGERSEFRLPSASPEEFPPVVAFEEEKYHEVSARLFRELIKRTHFATDTESSRYALGGILLEFESDKITAVGTDGRRLAKMAGPGKSVGGHQSGDSMTIVPTRTMQTVERALSDDDAEIQVAARGNDILIRSPKMTVYSRLVEGRYPKWRDVFPAEREAVTTEIGVGPFYSAVRQASVVASDESRGIDFTFGEGSLVLTGLTADVGQSRVELPIAYDGETTVVTLDHRYVADFLKVLDADKNVSVEIEGPDAAVLCTTDDGYGYVIMPLARDR